MALRLRRGTDAERLLITPFAGEPIFTTDTKQLFIGDGATLGGVPIDTTTEVGALSTLIDVDLTSVAPILNDVLLYNGSEWVTSAGTITSNLTGNVTGDVEGQLYGDAKGSIFGADSAMLVDGVGNQIVGDVNNTQITTQTVTINQDGLDATGITFNNVTSSSNGGNFNFRASRTSLASPTVLEAGDISIDLAASGWDGTTYSPSAVIKLGTDKYTSSIGTGVMPGRIVFLTYNELGATGADNVMVLNRFGNLGIGTDAPAEKLDVRGNIVATGTIQPGVYASAAARDIALPSPTAGQMVYITDVAKFQGNTDGTITGWADLN